MYSFFPLTDAFDQKFKIKIQGKTFEIRIKYNSKIKRYFIDLLNNQKEAIFLGRSVLPGINLIKGITDPKQISGELILYSDQNYSIIKPPEMGDLKNFALRYHYAI
jgi:hypothetical protein